MPAASETPDGLRLFRAHGVDLSHRPGASQAQGECPFCGKEKFHANVETGEWDCKSCTKRGNPVSFLWHYWELCNGGESDFDGLAEDRGLLDPVTLKTWGARQSVVSGDWLVPGYNLEGKPSQLYRYLPNGKGGMALMASPVSDHEGSGHQLFGTHLYNPDKPDLILVEGGWDGPALWETLSHAKRNSDGKVAYTKDPAKSILATTNVLGTPGCNVFHESWLKLFAGKNVSLFFDNDHPRKNKDTGKPLPPASWEGMKRIALLLVSSPSPPASVKILRWNDDGDHDPDLPKGYDVRDVLCEADDYKGRVEALADLFDLVRPMPVEWTDNKSVEDFLKSSKQLQPKPCTEFKAVVKAFKKALMWAQGLEDALACMLATILSTEALGDQLWLRVVGMPSCLHGDTPIHDPVDGTTKTVRERQEAGKRFFVFTKKDGGEVGVAEALPPVKHRPEQMYEVKFASGRSIKVTGGHRIWNGSSYDSVLQLAERLRQSDACRLPSISGSVLSTRLQGARHLLRTLQGSQSRCCACSCLCGGQPLLAASTFRGASPSPAGVQGRDHSSSYAGGQEQGGKCTPQHDDHLSTHGVCRHAGQLQCAGVCEHHDGGGISLRRFGSCEKPWHKCLGSLHSDKTQSPLEPSLQAREPACLISVTRTTINLGLPKITEEVVSVQPCGVEEYYDFSVPETQNYWAEGVFHHNCGKTVLCEAILAAHKHTKLVSIIKGFFSGMVTDKEGSKDLSLIAQLKNRTMVVKDADVLLQNPALKELMSQLRDIYDRRAASSYRNNSGRDYAGQNMSAIICGTESMRLFDSSELGERFVDVVVVEDMPKETERGIARLAARRSNQHVKFKSNGKAESQEGKEMILARQLTAGYINHLRANQESLLLGVRDMDDDTLDLIVRHAEFVAFMRTRPSKTQDETTQRELCIRLTVQLTRLAVCLAAVLNKREVDEEVLRIVRKVALDTSRGRTLEVVKYLGGRGKRGAATKAIAITVKESDHKLRDYLQFIGRIGVCRPFTPKGASMPLWRLTDRLQELYDEIFPATGDED